MLNALKDKTALITGAAKRIGRETTLTLSDRGINVVIPFDGSDTEARKLSAELQKKGVKAFGFTRQPYRQNLDRDLAFQR